MRDLLLAYFLCTAGLFTPLAGLHRFYLRKPVSGTLYLLTWGFFGIGTIIDLVRMPFLVDEFNMRLLFLDRSLELMLPRERFSSPERAILKCAQAHEGIVTVQMVTISTGLSMKEARSELERLYQEHFCGKDIDEEGNEIYLFKGLTAKKPLI